MSETSIQVSIELLRKKKTVLFEGAQATFLDLDFGISLCNIFKPQRAVSAAGAGVGPRMITMFLVL